MANPARTPEQDYHEAARVSRKLEALVDLGFERTFHPPVAVDRTRLDQRTWRVACARPAMNTHVGVTTLGPSAERLEEAVGRAFDEMDRLIGLLSRHDRASPLSHLNATGRIDGPPPELREVVATALDFHAASAGAFDISVVPLLDLFGTRLGAPVPAAPSAAEVRETLERVGARHVAASRSRIGFARPGMAVTLDGIAKGYIVDAIARVLDRLGVACYLIDAGGDIRTRGSREDGTAWAVGVRDPNGSDRFPDVVALRDGAVATSGTYEVYFDRARAFHHIVDARTGWSPTHSVSASVLAPSATAADALATAVLVMEPRAGVTFVESLRGCACLIIDRDGHELRSRGWRSAVPSHPEGADA
jgi:thiamine biosynthesis lipoprotein